METVWRVCVTYLFLLLAFRTLGKREVGRLAPFDLVILLMIPELVAQGLVREDFSITNALIAVSTLLALVFLTSAIAQKSARAEALIEGTPAILVAHGKLIPDALNRERISGEELAGQMHQSGIEEISQVKWAILETDGAIAFVRMDDGEVQPTKQADVA
jgi:uncharacterized membrane protein YcaP (DUF421 family)